jgi:hypothetical protein
MIIDRGFLADLKFNCAWASNPRLVGNAYVKRNTDCTEKGTDYTESAGCVVLQTTGGDHKNDESNNFAYSFRAIRVNSCSFANPNSEQSQTGLAWQNGGSFRG